MLNTIGSIKHDLARYTAARPNKPLWRILLVYQGAQASTVYRCGRWFSNASACPRLVYHFLWLCYLVAFRFVESTTGISINCQAHIGPGLYIPHFGDIVIGNGVKLGENCTISHGVTIGKGGRGARIGSPTIGDRVYVAPGAKLFGPITIGDDVAIGANAVVTRSLPDRAVAVGVPAKVISFRGSFDFVSYNNMENDEVRQRSFNSVVKTPTE